MDKPGWKFVGRVASIDGFEIALCSDGHGIQRGDVVAFAVAPDYPLRPGTVQVASVGFDWFMTDELPRSMVPMLADSDVVFKATALGEDALRRAR